MYHKGHTIAAVIIGGLFLLADQWLKFFARTNPFFDWQPSRWFGWDYFENPGVAFGLPIPNAVLLIITPIILLGLAWWFGKKKRDRRYVLGFSLILFGAISNYIDRMLFGVTIDYLRFFTSVINLADVMIVCGAGLLLLCETNKKHTG